MKQMSQYRLGDLKGQTMWAGIYVAHETYFHPDHHILIEFPIWLSYTLVGLGWSLGIYAAWRASR